MLVTDEAAAGSLKHPKTRRRSNDPGTLLYTVDILTKLHMGCLPSHRVSLPVTTCSATCQANQMLVTRTEGGNPSLAVLPFKAPCWSLGPGPNQAKASSVFDVAVFPHQSLRLRGSRRARCAHRRTSQISKLPRWCMSAATLAFQ